MKLSQVLMIISIAAVRADTMDQTATPSLAPVAVAMVTLEPTTDIPTSGPSTSPSVSVRATAAPVKADIPAPTGVTPAGTIPTVTSTVTESPSSSALTNSPTTNPVPSNTPYVYSIEFVAPGYPTNVCDGQFMNETIPLVVELMANRLALPDVSSYLQVIDNSNPDAGTRNLRASRELGCGRCGAPDWWCIGMGFCRRRLNTNSYLSTTDLSTVADNLCAKSMQILKQSIIPTISSEATACREALQHVQCQAIIASR